MEAYKALVLLFSLAAVARADGSTDEESGCIDEASGRVYRLWESWAPADEGCKKFTCMADGAVSDCACGRVQASPGCTLVYPKGSYPECCPRVWCPSGVKRFSVLLSGKPGQSNDPLETSGSRQDLQDRSSGPEDHTSSSGENGPERTLLSKSPQQVQLEGQVPDTREMRQPNFEENPGWHSDQPTHSPGYQHHDSSRTPDFLGRIPYPDHADHPDHHVSDHSHDHASDHYEGQPIHHLSRLDDSTRDQPLLRQRHSAQDDDILSSAQDARQQVSSFTSNQRTEERAPVSDAATQTPSFLSAHNSPIDTISRLLPQSREGLLQPVDLRSILSQLSQGMDLTKPQSPLAVFGNILKSIPGLPGSPEEMLKQILPPGMNPLLPLSQDNLIRLIVPDYSPEKPMTFLELLNKMISRIPEQISEFLDMPRRLLQLPNVLPNLFELPSSLLTQQRGSSQETSNPISPLSRLIPFNPLRSSTMSSSSSNNNNPLGPVGLLVQRGPAMLLSDFVSSQGDMPSSRDLQDRFTSGSRPRSTSLTSINPSDQLNNEQLLRAVGDINRRSVDTPGSGPFASAQLRTRNSQGGLFG